MNNKNWRALSQFYSFALTIFSPIRYRERRKLQFLFSNASLKSSSSCTGAMEKFKLTVISTYSGFFFYISFYADDFLQLLEVMNESLFLYFRSRCGRTLMYKITLLKPLKRIFQFHERKLSVSSSFFLFTTNFLPECRSIGLLFQIRATSRTSIPAYLSNIHALLL